MTQRRSLILYPLEVPILQGIDRKSRGLLTANRVVVSVVRERVGVGALLKLSKRKSIQQHQKIIRNLIYPVIGTVEQNFSPENKPFNIPTSSGSIPSGISDDRMKGNTIDHQSTNKIPATPRKSFYSILSVPLVPHVIRGQSNRFIQLYKLDTSLWMVQMWMSRSI